MLKAQLAVDLVWELLYHQKYMREDAMSDARLQSKVFAQFEDLLGHVRDFKSVLKAEINSI